MVIVAVLDSLVSLFHCVRVFRLMLLAEPSRVTVLAISSYYDRLAARMSADGAVGRSGRLPRPLSGSAHTGASWVAMP